MTWTERKSLGLDLLIGPRWIRFERPGEEVRGEDLVQIFAFSVTYAPLSESIQIFQFRDQDWLVRRASWQLERDQQQCRDSQVGPLSLEVAYSHVAAQPENDLGGLIKQFSTRLFGRHVRSLEGEPKLQSTAGGPLLRYGCTFAYQASCIELRWHQASLAGSELDGIAVVDQYRENHPATPIAADRVIESHRLTQPQLDLEISAAKLCDVPDMLMLES